MNSEVDEKGEVEKGSGSLSKNKQETKGKLKGTQEVIKFGRREWASILEPKGKERACADLEITTESGSWEAT